MYWNVPKFPVLPKLRSYYVKPFIGALFTVLIVTIILLLIVKQYALDNATIEFIYSSASFLGLIILTIFLINFFFASTKNSEFEILKEERQKLLADWEAWAKRQLAVMDVHTYFPHKIRENLEIAQQQPLLNQTHKLNRKIIKHPQKICTDLLVDFKNTLEIIVQRNSLNIYIISNDMYVDEKQFIEVWSELGYSREQLNAVVCNQYSLSDIWGELCKINMPTYALVIVIDVSDDDNKSEFVTGMLLHNAHNLIAEEIEPVFFMNRPLTTTFADISENTKDFIGFQGSHKDIDILWFCGLDDTEKQRIVETFIDVGMLSETKSLQQQSAELVLGTDSIFNGWYAVSALMYSVAQSIGKPIGIIKSDNNVTLLTIVDSN